MVNAGWIIDGLIIGRPELPILHGGGAGGSPHFYVLSKDEKIEKIEGENCYFDNSTVTGKLTFTIKSSDTTRQIGPFGYSGNPNGSQRYLVNETFTIWTVSNLNNVYLTNDRSGRFLGPIKNPRQVTL